LIRNQPMRHSRQAARQPLRDPAHAPMTDHPPLSALLRRLWAHLPAKRRFQLVAVFGSMLASGFAEIVSLAAVVPFLSVLADPERLWLHGARNGERVGRHW